jgi:hypothetical protein
LHNGKFALRAAMAREIGLAGKNAPFVCYTGNPENPVRVRHHAAYP